VRLNHIRDFVAVIQAGSLRAAARALNVSQPGISKSLRQLEAELGVQLLQRNGRGAVATSAGKTFLSRARVVQAELRKVIEDLEPFQGGSQGRVAFGIAPQLSMLMVPQALQQFRQRYPHARLRIVEGVATALLPAVRDETFDFAIAGSGSRSDAAIRFKPLLRLPLVVAARPEHPLRNATTLAELAEASWLMYYPLGTGGMLERAFAAHGLAMPRAIVQCESYATALALIANSDTLGLITPRMFRTPLGPYRLQQIQIRESIPAPLLGIYTRSDAPLTAAAAAMAQALTVIARRLARDR
jgi:LysR family transcriptional regulator, regulator of abg operon